MPCIHPDTRFRNGSRGATKWRETTTNMSFGPKEVDWACLLRKNKKWFPDTNSCLVSTPILVFAMDHVRQQNGAKPPQNMSFGPKEVDWHVRCEKTRIVSRGTNSCLVSTPILVFAMGHLRQRNVTKPPQTLVLDLNEWIGHVRCEKTRNGSGGTNSCLVSTPILVFAMGYVQQRMARNHPKLEFST